MREDPELDNIQANPAENKHGVQAKLMIIHGLERKIFRDQGDSEATNRNLSVSEFKQKLN